MNTYLNPSDYTTVEEWHKARDEEIYLIAMGKETDKQRIQRLEEEAELSEYGI